MYIKFLNAPLTYNNEGVLAKNKRMGSLVLHIYKSPTMYCNVHLVHGTTEEVDEMVKTLNKSSIIKKVWKLYCDWSPQYGFFKSGNASGSHGMRINTVDDNYVRRKLLGCETPILTLNRRANMVKYWQKRLEKNVSAEMPTRLEEAILNHWPIEKPAQIAKRILNRVF